MQENVGPTVRIGVKGRVGSRLYAAQRHQLRKAAGSNIDKKIKYIAEGGDLHKMWHLDADMLGGTSLYAPSAGSEECDKSLVSIDLSSESSAYEDNMHFYVRFIRLPPAAGSPQAGRVLMLTQTRILSAGYGRC